MARNVVFKGGKELEKALLELSERTAKKLARQALRKAAKPILDAAKDGVPVREGRLKRALATKVDQSFDRKARSKLPVMVATVGVIGRGAKEYRPSKGRSAKYSYQVGSRPDVYAKFVEFGTSDTAAEPFIRPAWDSEGGETASDRIGKEMGAAIEREATSLARKV